MTTTWKLEEIKRTSELEIEEYLLNSDFQEYVNNKKRYFQISDIVMEIKVKTTKHFSSEQTLGTIGNNLSRTKIKLIAINCKGIASNCSTTFGFLFKQKHHYYNILKIYVKWVVLHELIHIQQIKFGCLNEELREIEVEKGYEDRVYEQEAIERAAYHIIKDEPLGEVFLNYVKRVELLYEDQECFWHKLQCQELK